jgi:serine/threonine-protein kinase RIO1
MFGVCFRYHEGNLYVIDVSQSVEHDHPHALEFLRKDCTNVTGKKFLCPHYQRGG